MNVTNAGRLPFPGPGIEAVVFDLDGVVTDTALVHESAWKSVFDEFLRDQATLSGQPFKEFTSEEYGRYVDGKPRYLGARSFLSSRGVDLAAGDPSDPPGSTSVAALANRKNERFLTVLAEQGVEPFPESVRVLRELRSSGIQVGLITSSRNGRAVLKAAGVTSLFNAIIDGVDAENEGIKGKPAPDVFLACARMLGTTPDRTAIVEDSQAGVSAGRSAGFAFVLGVDRLGMRDELLAAGADAVVEDLGELRITSRADAPAAGHAAGRGTLTGGETDSPGTLDAVRPESSAADAAATRSARLLSELPSAIEAQAMLADRLRSGLPVVFLDYDGTLSPIVDDPAAASMPSSVHAAVERLAAMTPVAIVSGRDLRDVMERAGIEGVFFAGSHGFEIVRPDGSQIDTGDHQDFSAYLPSLDQAEDALRRRLEGLPGVIVERKRFAIAVHFRMADPAAVPAIEQAVERARALSANLRVTGGKKIFELRPDVDWDKGAALEVLMAVPELGGRSALPLYIGDDLTDEDGFRAVNARNGIAIAVMGEEDRPTIADFALEDPHQVGRFLGFLAAAVEGAGRESRQ